MTEAPPLGRLKRRREFLAAAKGRKAGSRGLALQGRRRHGDDDRRSDEIRLGFTCSKKVGNAVARNRARRRLKAAAAMVAPAKGVSGCDYVLIGRRATIDYPFDRLVSEMEAAFGQVGKKLEGGRT